jgi:indolepyruvate ferredoxin oxidoreductase beta subunit
VEATVRIGQVSTAFISRGEADVVVGLEPLETERIIPRMSAATTVLVNRTPIVPSSLTLDRTAYPDLSSIVGRIATVAGIVHVIDSNALAQRAGDSRLLNVVMLGALDGFGLLPIPTDVLTSLVASHGSGPNSEARSKAFHLGHEFGVGALVEGSGVRDEPVHS